MQQRSQRYESSLGALLKQPSLEQPGKHEYSGRVAPRVADGGAKLQLQPDLTAVGRLSVDAPLALQLRSRELTKFS